jgi:hypothetical protein
MQQQSMEWKETEAAQKQVSYGLLQTKSQIDLTNQEIGKTRANQKKIEQRADATAKEIQLVNRQTNQVLIDQRT